MKGKGAKRTIQNVNLFQRGEGLTQKFTFYKVCKQWKDASKLISFTQKCVILGSE